MNPEIMKNKDVATDEKKTMDTEVKKMGGGGPVQKYAPSLDITLKSSEEQLKLATYLHKSKIVPDSFESPEAVLLGMQTAMGFGFKFFGHIYRALTQMYVIKRVVNIWGDLPLAIVRRTGELSFFNEYFLNQEGKIISIENKNFNDTPHCAVCEASRKDQPKRSFFLPKLELEQFGIKLNDKGEWVIPEKKGAWKNHLYVMWQRRCRKKMINDLFPDVMYGIKVYEYDGDIIDVKADNKQIEDQFNQDFGGNNEEEKEKN